MVMNVKDLDHKLYRFIALVIGLPVIICATILLFTIIFLYYS